MNIDIMLKKMMMNMMIIKKLLIASLFKRKLKKYSNE